MNQKFFPLILTVAALTLAVFPARRGTADDDTKDVEIEVEAPLEATNCAATPPTITVLGVSIDISAARIAASAAATPIATPTAPTSVDDGGRRGKGVGSTQLPPTCYYYCTPPVVPTPSNSCAALAVGQAVDVKLASDRTPLAATEVTQDANSGNNVKLQAPLQAFDATAETIMLLGLTIDVSGAGLEGADDDSNDGHSQPIDLGHLMVGQSVETILASSTAPLTATDIEVKNFTNQLVVELTDPDGNTVGDTDDNGNPVDDVEVDVVQTVRVGSTTPAASGTSAAKVLHFHTGSNGHFVLRGLAAARAKIFVTRVHDGVTHVTRRTVPVKGDAVRALRLRLRLPLSR